MRLGRVREFRRMHGAVRVALRLSDGVPQVREWQRYGRPHTCGWNKTIIIITSIFYD